MAGRFLSINTECFNKARHLLPPGDSYHDGEALSCRRAFSALRMDPGKKEGKVLSAAFFLRKRRNIFDFKIVLCLLVFAGAACAGSESSLECLDHAWPS
jgi:hypothetical protein